ncbi:adenine deaminase [Paenibacillus cellulosilyticus]|uniref:Adenine deaminase n=1 Tax=Paenibacillus cellulosilyticus TaxID=375489 RepID=A0A2V2Z1H9_9BACL|nr:adenine deaminase [Paenibacillus cellulosilyticus]PWW08692.1 adenine deaminase [Paenibacillus cellulosilyticus]QKS48258.1 adenine deaminase [Paenibacillus cellulosilyticus]
MKINAATLQKRLAVASKRMPADVVVKNGTIVNVFTGQLMKVDIAIVDGVIAGIGTYEGHETIDASGKIIVPGLIDGHVHIESSMLLPREFAKVVLPHGVTTVITDPHEIANVAGADGIQYMLDDAEGLPLDVFVMLPSCVPATQFESNGATLSADQLAPFLSDPQVLGLAEVMDFPSVARGDDQMVDKLVTTQRHDGFIDGHAAGIGRDDLNIYMAAGIRTDHEGISSQEAQDRLDLGMYLMIREGTVAKDMEALLPVITERNARRCVFVTDDKLPDDLTEEGSVDHIVRLAIQRGLDPIIAVQMVTLNTAECFGLRHLGAIAAGYQADFLLLDDLNSLSIHQVYKKGRLVAHDKRIVDAAFNDQPPVPQRHPLPQLHVKEMTQDDLKLPVHSNQCNVIEIIPNSLVTRHRVETVKVQDGLFISDTENDQLKIAVIERHKATGNIGLGIVKGFQLKEGAIASTIAHDSHNIVVVGTSDDAMIIAIQQVMASNGGIAVVDSQDVVAALPLPVAGLMSDRPNEEVYESLKWLNASLARIGAPETFNPCLMLSFLTLPVIPELKLTDKGLFEFSSDSHIEVSVSSSNA